MRCRAILTGILFTALVAIPVAAAAQNDDTPAAAYVETTTRKIDGPKKIGVTLARLTALDEAFASGDMAKARAIATDEIIKAAKDAGLNADACNYQNNYIALVWVASDPAGKPVVHRLIVPERARRPYALDLPGIGGKGPQLYELFVAGDARSTLTTVYRSTPEENPLVKQLPTVAEKIIGPLFATVAGNAREMRRVAGQKALEPARLDQLYVTASTVVLPFRRATVQAKSTASVPKTIERVTDDVDQLAARLRVKDVAGYLCAQNYSDTLAALVKTKVQYECSKPETTPIQCLKDFDAAFAAEYSRALGQCFPTGEPKDDDVKALKKVDGEFRDYVLTARDQPAADVTFRNEPLTKVSLAAVTALAFPRTKSMTSPRVKLDDHGNIAEDPLGRVLTMIAFNWSPRGYDRQLVDPSPAERFRPFVGAIITPDFGVGGGGSVLLVRGLAINGGLGAVFSREMRSEDAIGKPPTNKIDPFALGTTWVWFVGASFNYK